MKVALISDEKITTLTQGTDYSVDNRVVTLTNPTSLKIQIYRETTTKPLVGWADASVLRAADMTVQSTQLLHIAEETMDKVQDGGLAQDTTDGVWDARYNRIKNLLDPANPGDAVTLNYITKNQSSLINQLKSTGAAQVTTITNTGNTQNTRLTNTGNTYVNTMTTLKNDATTQANLAKAWAQSDTSPDGVDGNKSSKTWANEAKTSATNAKTSETNAKTYMNNANTYKTNAATSATNAATSATNAATSATNAATSETNAKTYMNNANTYKTAAANSATAAAKSATDAAKFDPSSYMTKTDLANTYLTKTAATTLLNAKLNTADLTPVKMHAVFHKYGDNYVPSDTSNNGWASLGNCIIYYTQKKITNQPQQYGQLINICPGASGIEATQIFIGQPDGSLYVRGGNGSGAINSTAFKAIPYLNTSNHLVINGSEVWVE